jgi:hypothetical protein
MLAGEPDSNLGLNQKQHIPLWRRAIPPAVVYVAAFVGLVGLDAVWLLVVSPFLGLDYFKVGLV